MIVAGIAVLASIVTAMKMLELLYALSVLSLFIICFSLYDLKSPMQIEVGAAVMIIGCVLLFIAAYKRYD